MIKRKIIILDDEEIAKRIAAHIDLEKERQHGGMLHLPEECPLCIADAEKAAKEGFEAFEKALIAVWTEAGMRQMEIGRARFQRIRDRYRELGEEFERVRERVYELAEATPEIFGTKLHPKHEHYRNKREWQNAMRRPQGAMKPRRR